MHRFVMVENLETQCENDVINLRGDPPNVMHRFVTVEN